MSGWNTHIIMGQVLLDGIEISNRDFFILLVPKVNLGLQPSLPLASLSYSSMHHRPLWKLAAKLITGWHPRARKKMDRIADTL